MPQKKTVLTVKKEDLLKTRVSLPKKVEKVHKHRKDLRAQETKKDLERLTEPSGCRG